LLRQITSTINNAEFDGANVLDASAIPIYFLSNADGDQKITLSPKNLTLGGTILTISGGSTVSTVTKAIALSNLVDTSITQVNAALAQMGSQAKQIDAHNKFISKLSDTLEAGVGNLVDADLAVESARLQALQVQQQLGAQALSIANQSPQLILSLFQN
jgi:flagellin